MANSVIMSLFWNADGNDYGDGDGDGDGDANGSRQKRSNYYYTSEKWQIYEL